MIHGSSIVKCIDINHQAIYNDSVSKLFQSYIERVVKEKDGLIEAIYFTEMDNVKITDWTGWTNIICIKKISPANQWSRITSSNKCIIVESDSLIPIYHSDDNISGFHGEIKYSYTLMKADMITPMKCMMRIVNDENPFQEVIEATCTAPGAGYEIYTRSKFYNANGFHLFGSDNIPNSDKKLYK